MHGKELKEAANAEAAKYRDSAMHAEREIRKLREDFLGTPAKPTCIFPKVPGRTFFPNLSKIITFAAARGLRTHALAAWYAPGCTGVGLPRVGYPGGLELRLVGFSGSTCVRRRPRLPCDPRSSAASSPLCLPSTWGLTSNGALDGLWPLFPRSRAQPCLKRRITKGQRSGGWAAPGLCPAAVPARPGFRLLAGGHASVVVEALTCLVGTRFPLQEGCHSRTGLPILGHRREQTVPRHRLPDSRQRRRADVADGPRCRPVRRLLLLLL